MRIGGGALVQEAMKRVEGVTARIAERKPGMIPMVKEWRPGERLRQILAPQTAGGRDLSVERDAASVVDRRDMSVAM